MLKIGITGQAGFIGSHLYNYLGLSPEKYERIPFKKEYFDDAKALDVFVESCDVIVHLAAMNRHSDQNFIYETNVSLVEKLIKALERTNSNPHIIFSSSTQEEKDNLYGKSKREGRIALLNWAQKVNARFTPCLIPNVFGPFGAPFYNSVVATFCYQLCNNQTPRIEVDSQINLVYVGDLVKRIVEIFCETATSDNLEVNFQNTLTNQIKVSELLNLLIEFKNLYLDSGIIPEIKSQFELNLFNTFRSFIPHDRVFPVKYTVHSDVRGNFAEVIRLGIGGQVSYSTTFPGITRGNHFHTRKIERFSVVKGEALIQLRKIGTDKVLEFYLNGDEPAYVDMPIWFTHNIKNIGKEELLTIFWINEFYNPNDPDTYFENV